MKSNQAMSGRPSAPTASNTGRPYGNQRHSSVSSTDNKANVGSMSGMPRSGVQQAAMTPVQQKLSSNMFGNNAVINNYLTSGQRVMTDSQAPLKDSSSVNPLLYLNQFKQISSMKKSEIKQLQKYCEQNGLDFKQVLHDSHVSSSHQHQKSNQSSKSQSKERLSVNAPQANLPLAYLIQGGSSQQAVARATAGSKGQAQGSQRIMMKHNQTPQQHYGASVHHSNSTTAFERSPLISSQQNSQKSQHLMLNNSNQGYASQANLHQQQQMVGAQGQFIQHTSASVNSSGNKQSNSQGRSLVANQPQQQQLLRGADWKKPMIPSQMSINSVLRPNNQSGDPGASSSKYANVQQMKSVGSKGQQREGGQGANFSASNGYFSQKSSPVGRLSLDRGSAAELIHKGPQAGTKNSKLARQQPHVTPGPKANKGGSKQPMHGGNIGRRHDSTGNVPSKNDLAGAYSNPRRVSVPSQSGVNHPSNNSATSSVERKQQIDSGAGVISGSGGPTLAPQNQLIQRKDVSGFQRGIQVEIKAAAVQSRRKHGSIDAYKQGSANNHSGSTSSIRQGQGEIAPQRASVVASKPLHHPKNPIFAKFNATPSSNQLQQQQQQLPNVVRSQINSNVSTQGQTTAHGKAQHQSHTNSMPSIQHSGQKTGTGGHRPSSPSDEIRNQSSYNYTNGALSRGSVKQSSQHGLSGSNQMNLSLSQSSQQHHKSHKVNSVEQLQERRIAYEASQGKMANAQAQQKYQQAMMPSVKSTSNEMLLAYAQQNLHGPAGATPQEGLAGGASDPKVSSIVLSQASKPSPGYSNRHSRIKAKSNQSSLEHNKDSRERKPTEQSAANYQDQLLADRPGTTKKRGTVTAAQNSPRHHLFDQKNKQPRFPEQTPLTSKQQQERKQSAYKQLQSNEKQPSSNLVGQQIQNKSSSLVPKSDSQGRLIPSTSDFANAALQQHILEDKAHAGGQRRSSVGNLPQMTEEEYLNLVRQQQSSAQSQLLQRLDDQSAGSIEQYSRKLHTPNPILDGGTGAGGATSLQDQTRQLLREQREILDKLGLPQQTQHSDSQQVFGNYSTEINSQGRMLQQVSGVKPNIQQPKTPSMYPPPPQSNDHSMLSVASAQTMQQQRVIPSSHSKQQSLLQHQQQNQSITNIENRVLNLSDIISGGKISSKDVQTKTSAQTTNTASTHKHVVNPKFLQYAAGASSIQQSQNNPVQSGKNASAKLKKSHVSGPQGPQNLIMHQNVPGKRSNSQEIVIPNGGSKKAALQQSSAGKQQVHYSQANLMDAQVQGGDPRHNFVLARKHQQNQVAERSSVASKNQLRHSTNSSTNNSKMLHSKAEKRSSSQPTAAVSGVQFHHASGTRGTADHLYHEYEQRLQHQHGRVPEDPTHSRQGAGARSSQQVFKRSERENYRASDQQPTNQHPMAQQQQQVRPGSKALLQARIEPRGAQQHAQQASRPQSLNNVVVEAPAQSKGARKHQANGAAGVRHNIAKLQKESSHIQKRLRKQSSVPQLHQNVSSVHDRSDLSKSTISAKHSSLGMRKSQSNGPGRPQYSVNQPHAVAMPESSISDVEQRRLITEEDEQEIRQVASDINEQAFYGKIIRTKKAMKVDSEFQKLSPRSQEIGYVMQKVERTFAETQGPPVTDISFYRIGKMLGRGAFGKVNLAMHKLVRKLVALKSLNKHELTDEVQKAKLLKEVNLLLKLRHNHVVKIYETIETKKHIIIVMELCAGGDLLNYVRKRRRLKEPFAQKIFKEIIDGLSYIHSKNIAHRDIKLDNILLDGKGNVKIADFGVSRQIMQDQVMREQCGTPAYIAPEILRNRGYGLNVDLWSAGVVLFAMLYGTVPFKAQTMEELHSLILKGKYLLKEDISSEARDLLRGLLEIDPRRRISIRRIHKHPWLRNLDPSVQLFNDEERKMIKKEYTYNDGSRYNRNENEEPVDCFTQHNLESQYSTLKNHDSKSIILAPFNSTMSEESPARVGEERSKVMELMEIKQQVLRFSKKCREIDRQYEFNNNGQLDNGVYHKVVANNSFEQQDKFEETQGIEIEQTLHDSYRNQQARKGKSASNARNNNQLLASEPSSFLSNSAINYNIEHNPNKSLDPAKVQKLVSFGYPEPYVLQQMREMHPNYCTAGYYLLEMDQNYC